MSLPRSRQSGNGWLALAVAVLYPTVLTLGYFEFLAGTAWQYLIYTPGKVLQFALPLIYMYVVLGWRPSRPARFTASELALGLISGVAVALAAWLLYAEVLVPLGILAEPAARIAAQIDRFGLASAGVFALTAVFYAAVHSGLEEYYWRWFVFGRAAALCTRPATAIALASVAFAAHHVIVLGGFFGYASVWTWLLAGAIAIGGAFWCWLYLRFGRLWGAWLSHALVDASIFTIGFDIAFRPAG
jgi:membrane protease YdiL (CAAX protease family)